MATSIAGTVATHCDNELEVTLATQVKPFILKTKQNGNVAVVLVHRSQAAEAAFHLAQSKSQCRTCGDRVKQFHNLEGQDGQLLFPLDTLARLSAFDVATTDRDHDILCKISELARTTCSRGPIEKLMVVRGDCICALPRTQGADAAGVPYSHWFLPLAEEFRSDARVTAKYAALCDCAFHRYIASGFLDRLVHRLVAQGVTSLDLMKTCLDKVSFGKTFLPAVDWLRGILSHLAERNLTFAYLAPSARWIFLAEHLLAAGITKDSSDDAVSPLIQTASGNVIDLLESARSETQMMALCKERLSPTNYQRRTADASAGQIATAVKELGDFRNDVMLMSELSSAVAQAVPHGVSADESGVGGSLASFRAQLCKLNGGGGGGTAGTSSFAVRCGADELTERIKGLKTITEFVALTREHPELTVQIQTVFPGGAVSYLATTTLDKAKLQPAAQQHLWSFVRSRESSSGAQSIGVRAPFATVSHTVPMYEYTTPYLNILFVIPGASLQGASAGNCCFPEFLDTSVRRVCGPAYENLNKTMRLAVPKEPHVVGLGTSVSGPGGKLSGAITLCINGDIIVKLTHL